MTHRCVAQPATGTILGVCLRGQQRRDRVCMFSGMSYRPAVVCELKATSDN